MGIPLWVKNIPPTRAALLAVLGTAAAAFALGFGVRDRLQSQVGLPAQVSRTIERVTDLEERMSRAEQVLVRVDSAQVIAAARQDTILALTEQIACEVRAHARGWDPDDACSNLLHIRGAP